jgi:hypothetical protein
VRDLESVTRTKPADLWRLASTWVAVGLALGSFLVVWGSVPAFVSSIDHCELLFCDFTRHFYPMGKQVFADGRPVEGFFYPPFAALVLAPFGALRPGTARVLWGVLQIAATMALLIIPSRMGVVERPRQRFLLGLLVTASLPLLHNFKWGQMSVILTALALGALWLRESGKLALPAVLLAVAISIKAYPGVLLVYPLLRRDFRFVGLAAGLVVVLSVGVPAALLGPADAWGFFEATRLASKLALQRWIWNDDNSQFLAHVVARLAGSERRSTADWLIAGGVVAAANLGLLVAVVRARLEHGALWAWGLCFCSLPFILETSWPHYFAYLPILQVFVAATALERRPWGLSGWTVAVAWLVSVIGTSAYTLVAVGSWALVSGKGFFFFANLALLVALWVLLVGDLRAGSASVKEPDRRGDARRRKRERGRRRGRSRSAGASGSPGAPGTRGERRSRRCSRPASP